MRTCQRLLKLHISKCIKGQLHEASAETNFNIHENIVLPKNSTLILLRYAHEEVEDTWSKNQDTVSLPHQCDGEELRGQPDRKLISPSSSSLDSLKLEGI